MNINKVSKSGKSVKAAVQPSRGKNASKAVKVAAFATLKDFNVTIEEYTPPGKQPVQMLTVRRKDSTSNWPFYNCSLEKFKKLVAVKGLFDRMAEVASEE